MMIQLAGPCVMQHSEGVREGVDVDYHKKRISAGVLESVIALSTRLSEMENSVGKVNLTNIS